MGDAAAKWVLARPWMMAPDDLETIIAIADGLGDPEAVLARRGDRLPETDVVQVRDGVAVIPVHGAISRYADRFTAICGGTTVDILARDLRTAVVSEEVKAIVLDFDTPGGEMAGIGELAGMIRKASQVKPVEAYVSASACSAGLYLASACSRITISPTAIQGSMGVVWPMSRPDPEKKAKVIEFVSSQSPNKRPDVNKSEGREQFQAIVDDLATVFIADVAKYRGMDSNKIVKAFGEGGIRIGQAAVDCGMADRVGDLESCIEELSRGGSGNVARFAAEAETEKPMGKRINILSFITGLMGKADNGEIEASDVEAAIETYNDESAASAAAPGGHDVPETVTETVPAASIDAVREQLRKEMATELRAGRVDLFGQHADAFLALHGDKINPAEKDGLRASLVAASLIDAESPVTGFSVLGSFKANVAGRKPHGLTTEFVSADATDVAAKLSDEGLKVLGAAASNPDEAERLADAKQLEKMLAATERGAKFLAEAK